MSASCSAVGVRDDRAVAVGEHPVGQAHQEDAGHRRHVGQGLDDLECGPHGVRGGVRGAGHHAVDHVVVHQHGAEVRDVVDDLAGLLDGDALALAQFRVLFGELVAQLAGLRVEHRGRRQVDAEFGCAGPDLGLVAEDRQVGHPALQQPARRLEDAVVVALGEHDALAVRPGPVQQLVGRTSAAWSPSGSESPAAPADPRCRRRCPSAPARCRSCAARSRSPARGPTRRALAVSKVPRAVATIGSRSPRPDTSAAIDGCSCSPPLRMMARQRRKALGGMGADHGEHDVGAVAGGDHGHRPRSAAPARARRSCRRPARRCTSRPSSASSPLIERAVDGLLQFGHRRRDQQRLLGQHIALRRRASPALRRRRPAAPGRSGWRPPPRCARAGPRARPGTARRRGRPRRGCGPWPAPPTPPGAPRLTAMRALTLSSLGLATSV